MARTLELYTNTTNHFAARVTRFFADYFATKCRITMAFQHISFTSLHNFQHTYHIKNTYTKEFALVNNAFLRYVIAFEHSQSKIAPLYSEVHIKVDVRVDQIIVAKSKSTICVNSIIMLHHCISN